MESNRRLGINVSEDISKLRGDVQTSLAQSIKGHKPPERGTLEEDFSRKLPESLSKLHEEGFFLQRQVEVISSLHFPSISDRETNVRDPHPGTYDWLFKGTKRADGLPSASNVLDWLCSGRDIFWVSGKAGSGKSVLMKYLYNHANTRAALRKWAAGKDLINAGFFFWSAGTSMQKSQQGLLQSLLMCILKQIPALISRLCPDRWNTPLRAVEGDTWTKSELIEALTRFKGESVDSARICFFIDGMDEYEGEILDLLHLFKDLTASGSIKFCVSSRPWNVFRNFFRNDGGKKIILQDLNRPDIWRFAYEQLTEEITHRSNLMDKTDYLPLVEEIVERSSGVFLWVFLVVRSLLRGMTNLDTAEELKARLRELPTELDEFFREILNRGDKFYGKQTARLYILQLTAGDIGLSSWDLAHFAEEDQHYAFRGDVWSRHAETVEQLDEITRTRVLARCQDLLEFDDRSRLQFLHRSVKDFLETRDIFDELAKRAGEQFNGHLFICNSMLVQMKAILHHGTQRFITDAKILYPTAYLMRCFWSHTQDLAHTGQLSLELISALDETLSLFYAHSRNCYFCLTLWIALSIEDYYKGWIVDKAVCEGVSEILCLRASKTKQCIHKNEIWRKSPLEKALIYMRSNDRLDTVLDLLRRGANPSEVNWENNSVWESYLVQLEWPSNFRPRMSEIEILERLLYHGADPSFLFNKDTKSYKILSSIAGDISYNIPMPSHDFQRRVSEYFSIEPPELRRTSEQEGDIEEQEPSKRKKEAPSEGPS